MTSIQAWRLLALAGLGCIGASTAFAQDAGYYYGGLGAGQSRSNMDEARITSSVLPAGVAATSLSRDDRSAAYKLFGGYQFTPNWALEAGFFNLGKFTFAAPTAPAGLLQGKVRVHGLNLDLVGTLPLTTNLSALGRIGAQYAKTTDSFNGSGAAVVQDPSPTKRATNYKFGLGLQYAFNESVWLRGEAERYHLNDAVGHRGNVNTYTVSLVFPFGRAPAAQPVAMNEPYTPPAAGPAPAAPPEVVAATEPAVAAPRRVSFSAESLFGFDQSAIKPEGQAALDKFIDDLKGTQFDTILVEGHTDRLGSSAYNEKLSLQRAEAVKDYLVSKAGIDASKITATGKGEADPVTKPEDCKGQRQSAKLIACLQPDRRVIVEVNGMQ